MSDGEVITIAIAKNKPVRMLYEKFPDGSLILAIETDEKPAAKPSRQKKHRTMGKSK